MLGLLVGDFFGLRLDQDSLQKACRRVKGKQMVGKIMVSEESSYQEYAGSVQNGGCEAEAVHAFPKQGTRHLDSRN